MTVRKQAVAETPWWTRGAINFVAEHLLPVSCVFEWGAGGSTLWLAKRVVRVTCVEHDYDWAVKVGAALKAQRLSNVLLVYEDNVQRYADEIESEQRLIDLVSVDGRNRCECIHSAIPKLMPGGYLLLDDSERAEYAPAIALLSGWERYDFPLADGEPGTTGKVTTIWRKPERIDDDRPSTA